MTQTIDVGLVTETDTAFPVTVPAVSLATETDYALRILPILGTPPAWKLVVRDPDGSLIGTMSSTDTAANAPITQFDGQDPISDVGAGTIVLPITSTTQNGWLNEDRWVHVYARGARISTLLVGVPDIVIVGATQADELATFKCRTLFGLLEEGMVAPPAGWDTLPQGHDRNFDSSDPAYDISSWPNANAIETVSAAQSDWPLTPIGADMPNPSAVYLIGPNGYGSQDSPEGGDRYPAKDITFPDCRAVFTGVGDDGFELRVDGVSILTFASGFGNCHVSQPVNITAGVHRVWARLENAPVSGVSNPTAFGLSIDSLDAADNIIANIAVTDSSWKIWEDVHTTPGFTIGRIVELCVQECQARGKLLNVKTRSDLATRDAKGVAWANTWTVSTKAQTPVSSFFLRELGETYADFEMTADEVAGGAWLDVYQLGTRGQVTPVTLTKGSNIAYLSIEGGPTVATAFGVEESDRFHYIEIDPVSGHPRKEAPLSLGAQQNVVQADTVAATQLNQFGRKRGKVTLKHLTGPATSDAEYPPAYWTADTLAAVPSDINLTPAQIRVISMTWALNKDTAHLDFTPELGDLIVPADTRAALAVRKMTQALGGQSPPSNPSSG